MAAHTRCHTRQLAACGFVAQIIAGRNPPNSQMDLWHVQGRWRPEMGEAIQDGYTDLQLREPNGGIAELRPTPTLTIRTAMPVHLFVR